MNKNELEAFTREEAKSIKTELDDHLIYSKHQSSESSNSRNSYGS